MPQDAGNFSEEQIGLMDALDEHSCYGESKRMGENWCASFAREYYVPPEVYALPTPMLRRWMLTMISVYLHPL